jgi:hypothetical protein
MEFFVLVKTAVVTWTGEISTQTLRATHTSLTYNSTRRLLQLGSWNGAAG